MTVADYTSKIKDMTMLLVEENHASASTSMHTDNKMLYTEGDRPCGRGGRGESVRNVLGVGGRLSGRGITQCPGS